MSQTPKRKNPCPIQIGPVGQSWEVYRLLGGPQRLILVVTTTPSSEMLRKGNPQKEAVDVTDSQRGPI